MSAGRAQRLLRTGVLLLVLIGVAAVVGPLFIPWQVLSARFADRVDGAIGRELAIDGGLRLRLLPRPAIVGRGVRLSNPAGQAVAATMIAADVVLLDIDLWSLLRGRLAFERLVLAAPEIELIRFPDGTTNWAFVGRVEDLVERGASAGGAVPRDARPWRVETVIVRDGTVTYRNLQSGSRHRLDGVSAVVLAGSLTGPFRIDGDLAYADLPVRIRIAVDRLVEDRAVPVLANLAANGVAAAFSGVVSGYPQAPILSGQLSLTAGDVRSLWRRAAHQSDSTDAADVHVESFMSISEHGLSVDQVAARVGRFAGSGRLKVDFDDLPRASVTASMAELDLSALPEEAAPAATPPAPTVPMTVTADIGRIVGAGRTLGPARLTLAFDGDAWTVRAVDPAANPTDRDPAHAAALQRLEHTVRRYLDRGGQPGP